MALIRLNKIKAFSGPIVFSVTARIRRHEQLIIDDYESVATRSGQPQSLQTGGTVPFHVGGLPDEGIDVRSAVLDGVAGFVGCIGDVTINSEARSLARSTRQLGVVALDSECTVEAVADQWYSDRAEEDEMAMAAMTTTPMTTTTEAAATEKATDAVEEATTTPAGLSIVMNTIVMNNFEGEFCDTVSCLSQ